jgi:hypothetical protein
VNIVAVVFGVFLLVNVGWPRAAVYDPAGQSWVLHYSAPLSVVFSVGLGLLAFRVMKRQRPASDDPVEPVAVATSAAVVEMPPSV